MLTKEILYGLNILTLAGFVLMGIGLTLNRQQKIRVSIAFALMGAGTVLVFLGIYVATPAAP
jgi:multisubunit Na+/H+ antiporter MnhC subunit